VRLHRFRVGHLSREDKRHNEDITQNTGAFVERNDWRKTIFTAEETDILTKMSKKHLLLKTQKANAELESNKEKQGDGGCSTPM